jgi:hypothetical protein
MIHVRFCSINYAYLAHNKNGSIRPIINCMSKVYIFIIAEIAGFLHICGSLGSFENK